MAKKANSISVAVLSGMGLESQLKVSDPDFIFPNFITFAKFLKDIKG